MSFTIMRDELQRLLAAKLPPGTIRFNKQLVTLDNVDGDDGGVQCLFSDGSSAEFDLVVGCDGIKSKVRRSIVGTAAETSQANSGLRIRFGVAPAGQRPADAEGELHQWFGDGAYALTGTYGGIGGARYEMIALTTADDSNERDENPNWDTAEVREESILRLKKAGFPDEVVSVAEASTRFFDLGIGFQNPLVPWSSLDGTSTLLGDAAHAMPPFLGQGANQAIQDAYCLASELSEIGGKHQSTAAALAAYEFARKPVTAALMLESRFLGFVETQSGVGSLLRDGFFWTTDKTGVAKQVFLKGAVPRV